MADLIKDKDYGARSTAAGGRRIDFNGIPAGASSILVSLDALGLTGGDGIAVRLGTASGYVDADYSGASLMVSDDGVSELNGGAGVLVASQNGLGDQSTSGGMTLTRMDRNRWACTGAFFTTSGKPYMTTVAGSIELPADVDRISVVATGGGTFAATGGVDISSRHLAGLAY